MTLQGDTLVGWLVGLVLFLFAILPMARRAGRQDDDPRIATIIALAGFLRLVVAPAHFLVLEHFYQNVADETGYQDLGAQIAAQLRHGILPTDFGGVASPTAFVSFVLGIIYSLIGNTRLGGSFVFSFFGFCGLYLFYRAFRTALPAGNHRHYCALVLLWPSLLFWPSFTGKEAPMLLGIGLAAWGSARALVRAPGGFTAVALGLVPCMGIRPHVGLLVFLSFAFTYFLRPSRKGSPTGLVVKVAGLSLLTVAGLLVIGHSARFFHLERLDVDTVEQVLEATAKNSQNLSGPVEGGPPPDSGSRSSFDPSALRSPAKFPYAVFTVVFRPLPYEAVGVTALVSSLEDLLLLLLVVLSAQKFLASLRRCKRDLYVAFALVYSLIFVYLFSAFGNFGLLARERVQLLPILFVLIAGERTGQTTGASGPQDLSEGGSSATYPTGPVFPAGHRPPALRSGYSSPPPRPDLAAEQSGLETREAPPPAPG